MPLAPGRTRASDEMRLFYLMTEPFGIGGVQSDLLTLTADFTRRGHQVHAATTAGVLLDELRARGARWHDIDFRFRGPGRLLHAALELRRTVLRERIELVAPQSVRSAVVSHLALRLAPLGYTVDVTGRRPAVVTTIHNIHNPIHFRYGGFLLNQCSDFVIFESHYERNRLLSSGLSAQRSTVIHSGIDTERFAPRPRNTELLKSWGVDPERHVVFGIVARLSEEKGHRYLVEAFAAVHRALPRSRLMIVGDGPLLGAVKDQAAALGVGEAVVFTGLQRAIPDFLAAMDVFVLSSTRESFPLAAREAMAAGRAVIAPRIGGCGEVVDDGVTGLLFPAGDVTALADAMRRILQDGSYLRLGEAARERVERLFSRRQWVEGDEAIYLRFLGGSEPKASASLAR